MSTAATDTVSGRIYSIGEHNYPGYRNLARSVRAPHAGFDDPSPRDQPAGVPERRGRIGSREQRGALK